MSAKSDSKLDFTKGRCLWQSGFGAPYKPEPGVAMSHDQTTLKGSVGRMPAGRRLSIAGVGRLDLTRGWNLGRLLRSMSGID
ncbi:hypothetical protein TNCV_458131 [Trichonephila clavipes]|nr:hypothetical protein TNCV_458131 [Trichonephila clavipes]